jgi:polysaccharide chain length determinant protein (PEP-CTERM system associated)
VHELLDQVLTQARGAWRYRWYAAAVAWIIAIFGWTAVHLTPDRYEAQARVFVDTQTILRPLLIGLAVQPNMDQTVAMVSRTLVNRANVEKVIEMVGLGYAASIRDRERLIARLSQEFTIRSAGRENLYTITYTDGDRETARRVVDSLLTLFMEASLGGKRRDSDSAREFIEEQLNSYSEKLVSAENAVTEFKRRNQGLMSGEGRDFYGALSEARATLRRSSLELKEAMNSRDAIKQQLAGEARLSSRTEDKVVAIIPATQLELRIRALEEKLDGLRLTYTELHPDIVALSRIIAQLKEEKASEETERKRAEAAGEKSVRAPQGPLYEQLMVSLAAAEANVAAMRARVAEHEIRHKELQAATNALPQIEAEYKQLTRDYEVIKARYDKLLERRESAQISGAVEASEAGMGFRIIDPPQAPFAPSSPDRLLLMSLTLLAAFGGGIGVALLLSQVKTTFNDERRLKEASGMRVLGTVAMSWNERQKKRRLQGLFAFVMSYLGLFSAYGAIVAWLMFATARV